MPGEIDQANQGPHQAVGLDTLLARRHDVLLTIMSDGVDRTLPAITAVASREYENVFFVQDCLKCVILALDNHARRTKRAELARVSTHDIEIYCFAVKKILGVPSKTEIGVDVTVHAVQQLTKAIFESALLVKSGFPAVFDHALSDFLKAAGATSVNYDPSTAGQVTTKSPQAAKPNGDTTMDPQELRRRKFGG